MNHEMELIIMVENYLAQVSYYNELKFKFGRATQQKDKVADMRRGIKKHIATRRLALAADEKKAKQLPEQKSLF